MIGLYIHVPFCKQKCRYCSFVSGTDLSFCARYVDCLIKEIRSYKTEPKEEVDTVFYGGGTPSMLSVEQLGRIMQAIRESFSLAPDVEITCEANPESATKSWMESVRGLGVNRLSLGVQSLDDTTLNAIGRLHDSVTAINAVKTAVELFPKVNADYMVGLPHQTVERVDQDVKILLDLGIKHLSCYSLILEENTPLYKDVEDGLRLPDEDATVDMYDKVVKMCAQKGLSRYEISNFSYPGCECRHNANCWEMHPYIGFGAAAHSFYKDKRFFNPSSVHQYVDKIERGEVTSIPEGYNSRQDRINETIMLALRTAKGLDINEFNRTFCIDFATEYANELADPLVQKCCDLSSSCLKIKPQYLYISNSITALFLR